MIAFLVISILISIIASGILFLILKKLKIGVDLSSLMGLFFLLSIIGNVISPVYGAIYIILYCYACLIPAILLKLFFRKKKKNISTSWISILIFLLVPSIYFRNEIISFASNFKSDPKKNGDLEKEFKSLDHKSIKDYQANLIRQGWKEENVQSGNLPICYNYSSIKGKINNYLNVQVGNGTDVVIKVIDIQTKKCIRFVFINSDSDFQIENIPEGEYLLRIAYGKNWMSKIVNGRCIGKFTLNPIYSESQDIYDFHVTKQKKSTLINNYFLKLDVISNSSSPSFNSKNISENEFNS